MKKHIILFFYFTALLYLLSSYGVQTQIPKPTTFEIIVKNTAFEPSTINIEVGDSVIFKWNTAALGHNVAQVRSSSSTSFDNGFRSANPENGPNEWILPNQYVQENITLYYISEPHVVSHSMRGKIIVGEGSEEDGSGGGNPTAILAIFGASIIVGVVAIFLLNKKK